VDAIWLSPHFPSPNWDCGYDISDYCAIDPVYGTLADFDALLAAVHARNLRVILDLVPDHTSDQHLWFLESRASLVVLANNETLALVTKLLRVTSVVFALEPIESKALAAWIASFYDFLAGGFTLRDSCRKAFAQHQLPMTLYPRLAMDMTLDGGPQADDAQPRLEPAGQFALANQS